MNITVVTKDIATYESELMTKNKADELDSLRSRLKSYFDKYKEYSTQIQQELDDADAPQEDYDAEAETVRLTEEEIGAAKIIAKRKIAEWDAIENKEKQEDWERKEKLRLDDLARRKKEEEEENRKTLLLIMQQQQLHTDAQRAKEIQDQDTKRAQEFQQLLAATRASTPMVTVNAPSSASVPGASSTRLPQRQIRHFKGDIMEWTSFWETFNAAIHSSSLSAVQKFDYLKEYLKGEARLFVENLELTDANYQIAINQLKATYGKTEVLINAHFDKLDSLQPVKDGKDVTALQNLQLTIQSHICALETLGKPKDSYGSLLGTKLIKLVPYKLQEKWAEVATNDSTDIEKVLKFIQEQTDAAERLSRLKSVEKTKSSNQANSQPTPKESTYPATASQLVTGVRSHPTPTKYAQTRNSNPTFYKTGVRECNRPCIFCNEAHWPTRCGKNLKERRAIIADLKRCTNCFGQRHENKDCTSVRNCNRCDGRHHTALCDKKETRFTNSTGAGTSSSTASGAGPSSSTATGSAITITIACSNIFGNIMLKTATVYVIGPDGRETKTILFADRGSHRSWVLNSISKDLKLKRKQVEKLSVRRFQQEVESPPVDTNLMELRVRGTWDGAPIVNLLAFESDYVANTGPYIKTRFAEQLWLKCERLADDRFDRVQSNEEEPSGILVGMDQLNSIISQQSIQSPCGLRAYDTPFGKMLGGPSQETPSRTGQQIIQKFISNSNFCSAQIVKSFTTACASSTKVYTSQSKKESSTETGNTCLLYPNENKASLSNASNGPKEEDDKKMMVDELNNANFDLSLFWKIESFANLDGADAVESDSRFDTFEDEITRLPDGRYSTPIPWTTDKWRLERNLQLATGRLESTLIRLRKSPQDLMDYEKEIQQLMDNQFVEVADLNYDGHHTYLPHHPVYRRDKNTTKIRPVFDGAAKSKYGPSLNEVLETGPN